MTVWFVTPAWKRYDLSAVCFDQRRDVIDRLAERGIEAHCVVVADDDNLDLARERGFATVRRNNDWLGRKFNDGMEYAAKHDAEWIVPIGSDSWIDPGYFLDLPSPHLTRTSPVYCHVTADRLIEARVRTQAGAGPYIFNRRLLERTGFRPAEERLRRGIDGSTLRGIAAVASVAWQRRNLHEYQYVGFRVPPYITPPERLAAKWGVGEHRDPWAILARHYPPELVDRARQVLTMQAQVAA